MARHYIIQDELHYLKCDGCGRIFFENMESEVIKRDVEDLAAERGWHVAGCSEDGSRVDVCPGCLRSFKEYCENGAEVKRADKEKDGAGASIPLALVQELWDQCNFLLCVIQLMNFSALMRTQHLKA